MCIRDRYKIDPSGNTTLLEPLFLPVNSTSFIDKDIQYGHDYVYKIRTLALLEKDFLYFYPSSIDDSAVDMCRGAFLIASRSSPIRLRCIETQPPNAPDFINFKMDDYDHSKLQISWNYPHNPQEDLAGFEIYRREGINDPFTLIGFYNFAYKNKDLSSNGYDQIDERDIFNLTNHLTAYDDSEFNKRREYIYDISSAVSYTHLTLPTICIE